MCEICRREECADLCPNNDGRMEPPHYCLVCARPIYRGEIAYALEEGVACEDCVREMAFEVTD